MKKYKEAILYTILILLGFIYVVTRAKPEIVKIFDIEKNIKEKSVQVADLERKLETLKKSMEDKMSLSGQAKQIYKPEVSGLDVESSFTVIFDDIIDMARYNAIKIYSIEYVYDPPSDEFVKGAHDKYNVCQLNMQLITDYQNLEGFLQELYKYPYLVNIDKLELTPYPKDKKILLTYLQLKLYSSK